MHLDTTAVVRPPSAVRPASFRPKLPGEKETPPRHLRRLSGHQPYFFFFFFPPVFLLPVLLPVPAPVLLPPVPPAVAAGFLKVVS